jgi:hypothetical protein
LQEGAFLCEFDKQDPHARLAVQLYPEGDVLGRAYLESNDEKWERFEAVTIAGQPGVVHSLDPPGTHTTCEVVVRGFTVNASGSDNTVDWCGKAVRAAEFVVGNLGG